MRIQSTKQYFITGIFLLVTLLISSISHSHEYTSETSSIEQFDCKLCQQQTDSPKHSLKLAEVKFGFFTEEKRLLVSDSLVVVQYRSANPRAPPNFT